ncbi:hypothetical protein DSL72_008654 [Monilinia vaccinii-corymbosi]|uniref:SprT-like domain-containing protein n=1 Tax=Monilinia vaccinii-corymbosi TaxID=61207 RepID=A0A8A3PS08_9HELO|nr:hypothetical protein DSL72_008654 [Monilinia vaccinii-corymbosi]
MLHEMVHAFFSIYVCKCNAKCRRTAWEFDESGATGHWLHWQNAARSIERFVRYGLRLDIRLGREEALGLELIIGRKEIWCVYLEEMGMDRDVDWYAQVVLDDFEERGRIKAEEETGETLEKLEKVRWKQEGKDKGKWEMKRPEREREEKKALRDARVRIHKALRLKNARANWSGPFFTTRLSKTIPKPLPPPPPQAVSQSVPNYLLTRRSHFTNPDHPHLHPSIATRRRLATLQKLTNTNTNTRSTDPETETETLGRNLPTRRERCGSGGGAEKKIVGGRRRRRRRRRRCFSVKKQKQRSMVMVTVCEIDRAWDLEGVALLL